MSTANPREAPMYNLLALLIVTAVASWCASKVYYDRQKAEEEYRKFRQLAIIIFTIIASLTTQYVVNAWRKYRENQKRKEHAWETWMARKRDLQSAWIAKGYTPSPVIHEHSPERA